MGAGFNNFHPHWEKASLRELVQFVIGGDWGKAPDHKEGGYVDVLCIRGTELRNWNEERGRTAAPRKIKHSSLERRMLNEGDIILEVSGGGPEQPVGRIELIDKQALAENSNIPKICTNFFRRIVPSKEIDSSFLVHFLKYFYISGEINNYQAGSNNLRNLKYPEYEKIEVPVPPHDEQHRIVEKIETLFARIDKGEEALREVQKLLKRHRQSILKAAVTGELTRDWREANKDKLEPASELLARILQTRCENWQGRGKYKEPVAPDTTDLPELPKGWVWTTLGAMITNGPQNGLYLPQSKYGSGTPILRIDDYQIGWMRSRDDLRSVKANKSELQKYSLMPGDFVVNRVNSVSHLGKAALITDDYTGIIFESNMMRFSVSSEISKEYLLFYLTSEFGRKPLIKNCKHAVNQASINQGDIAATPVPLPSLLEQQELAQRLAVESSRELITKQWCQTELTRSAALRKSILKSAFTGKLVPQDPNDEPASELLARIRAEA